jgi:PAS domain S-box-containing protein
MNSEPSPDGESSRQWECHSPLFEGTTDPIAHVKLDAERSILDVNTSFEKVFGCDRAGVSGRSLLDVAAPETETDEQVEAIPTTPDGDPIRREVRRATADGSRVFLYQFIPGQEQETDGGRRKDGYAVYTDLTDRANRESERVDSEQYRKRLYTITSDTGLSDEKKITQLLELGCERLGVENGHLATIVGPGKLRLQWV